MEIYLVIALLSISMISTDFKHINHQWHNIHDRIGNIIIRYHHSCIYLLIIIMGSYRFSIFRLSLYLLQNDCTLMVGFNIVNIVKDIFWLYSIKLNNFESYFPHGMLYFCLVELLDNVYHVYMLINIDPYQFIYYICLFNYCIFFLSVAIGMLSHGIYFLLKTFERKFLFSLQGYI
jgi:hypothetical protein